MVENITNNISLIYKDINKQIMLPKNYFELKEIFKYTFNEDSNSSLFSFFYKDKRNEFLQIEKEDKEFNAFLKQKVKEIYVKKENENNINEQMKEENNKCDEIKMNENEDINNMKLRIKYLEDEVCKEKEINKDLSNQNEIYKNNYIKLETKYNNEKELNIENLKKLEKTYNEEIKTIKINYKEEKDKIIEEQKLKYIKIEDEYKNLQSNYNKVQKDKLEMEKKYEEMKKKIEIDEKHNRRNGNNIIKECEISLLNKKHNRELSESLINEEKNVNEVYNIKLIKLENQRRAINNSICDKISHIIKCQRCFKEPIIGNRYKCNICTNYYLCQECEEKNLINREHSHNFTKIRNELKINDNDYNYINNNIDEYEYSYKCLNSKLKVYIYKGTDEATITITLKNNKNKKWPENTKLIADKNDLKINCNNINLNPLNYGEQNNYEINFKGLKDLNQNEYKIYYNFNVNGKNYGEKICLSIFVKENNSFDMVEQFRNKYQINKGKYSDDLILKKLKENNYSFEITFFKLYFL